MVEKKEKLRLVCYTLDLLWISTEIDLFDNLMATEGFILFLWFISVTLSLFISYNIIMGIKDVEATRGQYLNSVQLYSIWQLMLAFEIITFILHSIPELASISMIMSIVFRICYLSVFNKTKRFFNKQNQIV